jgi:DNA-binding response OmpR family regulator
MRHHRTVLVVEDDPAIRTGLLDALAFAGYRTAAAARGDEGLQQAVAADLDLVILDVVLPDRSGFEVLEEIRRCRPRLPVIMVTARGAEPDRIHGLRQGADDYVVKPFSAGELLARVEAVLRRSAERPLDVRTAQLIGCRVDFARREATRTDGTVAALSDKEVDILRYLVANPGRAIPRAELLQRVWGFDPKGIHTRTIDMHVLRLREKLGDDAETPRMILTVRGTGYMLQQPEVKPG